MHAGPVVFELLQPLEGPSIYKEWLDEARRGTAPRRGDGATHEQADDAGALREPAPRC